MGPARTCIQNIRGSEPPEVTNVESSRKKRLGRIRGDRRKEPIAISQIEPWVTTPGHKQT